MRKKKIKISKFSTKYLGFNKSAFLLNNDEEYKKR